MSFADSYLRGFKRALRSFFLKCPLCQLKYFLYLKESFKQYWVALKAFDFRALKLFTELFSVFFLNQLVI